MCHCTSCSGPQASYLQGFKRIGLANRTALQMQPFRIRDCNADMRWRCEVLCLTWDTSVLEKAGSLAPSSTALTLTIPHAQQADPSKHATESYKITSLQPSGMSGSMLLRKHSILQAWCGLGWGMTWRPAPGVDGHRHRNGGGSSRERHLLG